VREPGNLEERDFLSQESEGDVNHSVRCSREVKEVRLESVIVFSHGSLLVVGRYFWQKPARSELATSRKGGSRDSEV
jgi:hypothetical protein